MASGRIGEMIEGQYSNYVLQKIMDTAPTTVAQDLMVLLRYEDKGTVQQLCPTEDNGHCSHYRGAGPHGLTQVLR